MQPLNRRVFTGKATDIGWFSGSEKLRLELTSQGAYTKRFAIALFSEDKINPFDRNLDYDIKNKKWVKLKGEGGEFVYADISSLASRLQFDKNDILDILEDENRGIQELEKFIVIYINSYILKESDKKILPEKITSRSIKKENLVIKKSFLNRFFTGKKTVKLKLLADKKLDAKNRLAIETDGYLYKLRPEESSEYVPYALEEGQWVLVNVNSLCHRLGLEEDVVREKASKDNTGEELKKFLTIKKEKFLVEQKRLQQIFENKWQIVKEAKKNENSFELDKDFKAFTYAPFNDLLSEFRNLPNRVDLYIYAKKNFWWIQPEKIQKEIKILCPK